MGGGSWSGDCLDDAGADTVADSPQGCARLRRFANKLTCTRGTRVRTRRGVMVTTTQTRIVTV